MMNNQKVLEIESEILLHKVLQSELGQLKSNATMKWQNQKKNQEWKQRKYPPLDFVMDILLRASSILECRYWKSNIHEDH